jgi:hypothetical protein
MGKAREGESVLNVAWNAARFFHAEEEKKIRTLAA